jgi:hypothetical protein
MTMEDAWGPVDEVAGTAVDTFIYGVEREDGIFYPSKATVQFGEDRRPFKDAYEWRTWENMKSLEARGLDPLTVLIDRAHEKGMEFFASLRLAGWGGMDPALRLKQSHARGNFAIQEVRDHGLAVLKELAESYAVDGVELDFSFVPYYFERGEARENLALMTDYVRQISEMVRGRPGGPGQVGARVLPTEEMCLNAGLDVRAWLRDGLVDFVVPVWYQTFNLDPDMPIDWLVKAAHEADIPVYGMLQPYARDESRRFYTAEHATPAMIRAASANFLDKGVDGLYAWFLGWPLGDSERRTLTELGDHDLIKEGTKHYHLRRQDDIAEELGYAAGIPLEIPSADPGARHAIPFYVADDIEGASGRIRQVQLRINIGNLVSADRLTISLNGKSLAGETCLRSYADNIAPYTAQWLDFRLEGVRPRKGENLLELSLDSRPAGLEGGITVDDVEIIVEYSPYPSGLR